MTEPSLSGSIEPQFASVRAAFEDGFARGDELGAAIAVYHRGKLVVDLWGGEARDGSPWQRDTLCCGFSVAKAITATAIAVLVDRGELDLDAPIASVWPEFAQAGKQDITLRTVLTHRAGTNWFPDYESIVTCDSPDGFADLERIADAIAAAPPVWEPDTRVGYTSMTIGWIASAIVRRVTGTSLGDFLAAEVVAPLGARDVYLGVPAPELGRVADLAPIADWEGEQVLANINPDTPAGKNLFLSERTLGQAMATLWNDDAYRQAEQGAINVVGSARDVARVFAMWAGRGRLGDVELIGEATAREFMRDQTQTDEDAAIHSPLRLGLVFWKTIAGFQFGAGDDTVAHVGLGGAVGIANPEREIAVAYLPRRLDVVSAFTLSPRLAPVLEAVYESA